MCVTLPGFLGEEEEEEHTTVSGNFFTLRSTATGYTTGGTGAFCASAALEGPATAISKSVHEVVAEVPQKNLPKAAANMGYCTPG